MSVKLVSTGSHVTEEVPAFRAITPRSEGKGNKYSKFVRGESEGLLWQVAKSASLGNNFFFFFFLIISQAKATFLFLHLSLELGISIAEWLCANCHF